VIWRGSLFVKYAIPLVVLVSGALVVSGLVEIYFSYKENKSALARIQHEKAAAAAIRIEQFVRELEHDLSWIAQTPWGPRGVPLDQRRLDSLRLLRQVPAITEVSHIDPAGREQLRVSRLAMDVIGSNADLSRDLKFVEAMARKTYFSPVYFRKESEPYMTIAMTGAGEDAGVVAAEANLKFIWDVVSTLKVGKGGYAYVVDANGRLIAHPDISLVLQKTDLSTLPQVRAAAAVPVGKDDTPVVAMIGRDVRGTEVLSAHAAITPLNWSVFVELPVAEAFASLYASIWRTVILVLVGVVISIVASLFIVRRMVSPIQALRAGAARIGAGALEYRIAVKSGDELQALADEFNRMTERLQESYAGLERKVEERTRDLRESLEQQTATSEILRVISQSQRDIQPVFETIVANARKLCDATFSVVYTFDGELVHLAAAHGINSGFEAFRQFYPMPLSRASATTRAILTRAVAYIPDIDQDSEYRLQTLAEAAGYRSALTVPMLREGSPIGAIGVVGAEPAMFSESQIAVLQTFADQAVIAIENVRLFKELEERNKSLTEALEQQTATSDILRVISQSQTDVQPVFEAIAANARRLCQASSGWVNRFDGEFIEGSTAHTGATHEALEAIGESYPMRPSRGAATGRAILTRAVVYVPDVREDPEYRLQSLAQAVDFRSIAAAPMIRDGNPIGAITVLGGEPAMFSERQIELLKTFADQAVIAIENVRLFKELEERNKALTEALEQQTATSEILRVISSSPTDTQPVFATILESATRLCEASFGVVFRVTGDRLIVAAHHNLSLKDVAALDRAYPQPLDGGSNSGTAVLTRSVIQHIHGVESKPTYPLTLTELQREVGFRATLQVPMLRAGGAVGVLSLWRRTVTPFSEQQIDLLKTFADQAVIAIENVRLFTELQEQLEQQTATSEILRVISSSPTDVQPVLDVIVEHAAKLCAANDAVIMRVDGDIMRIVAHFGRVFEKDDELPTPIREDIVSGRAVLRRQTIHVPDLFSDAAVEFAGSRDLAKWLGYRALLVTPLLRETSAIGVIVIRRAETTPFSAKQIDMLKTFADQAVIAIENVRLFKELEERNKSLTEALEQQTATSEILRVISSSPTDLQPIFDAIVQYAARLCGGTMGALYRYDGQLLDIAATLGVTPESYAALRRIHPAPPSRAHAAGRSVLDGTLVHIPDVTLDKDYRYEPQAAGGHRSVVSVPMLREGKAIGTINVLRSEPRAFSERELDLLKTFADQAVIAIENTRLFKELQVRTQDLGRSVGQLQALADVSQTVNSTLDLEQVLSAIVTRAVQLSSTDLGAVYEHDEQSGELRLRATYGAPTDIVEALMAKSLRVGEGATGRAAETRAPVEIADIKSTDAYSGPLRDVIERAEVRSVLAVPLLREQRVLGGLTVSRRIAGSFPPGVIEILQTFAAQSAIAIQNARLFRELEQKGHELEIASQHKSQFLANMSHELRTPLNAILGYTELIVDQIYGKVPEKIKGVLERVQKSGRHLLGLINDVLDLSKIEAGQLTLSLSDYSFQDAVQSVVASVESLAKEKGLRLAVEVAQKLPVGRADERRIVQVLLNLVGNAIKFTDAGEVKIRVSAVDGAFIASIADTGPGIPKSQHERIFEEFQQVDGSSTRAKGGTGLGLAIAKKIIELHGGRIWVESVVGKGSTFTFSLPVRTERQEEAA